MVYIVIGSWWSGVIGSEDGEWRLVHFDPVCKGRSQKVVS